MIYNTYELIWLFLIYSFLGWMLETILAATEQRRFVNRGLINGPLCTIYGVPIVILTIFGSGIAAVLAVPGSHDRGDSHGMDQWTYDRTVLP